jgi:hypothetical protein
LPDQHHEDDTTRATAHLPGLEIEIVHRRAPGGDAEQISINLQAVPSFEAFGRFLEAAMGSGDPDGVAALARSCAHPDTAPEHRSITAKA